MPSKIKNYYDGKINLRISTRGGEIRLENVSEYVCGKLFFYINMGVHEGVKVIDRSVINMVYRYTDNSEWPINLKQFKD